MGKRKAPTAPPVPGLALVPPAASSEGAANRQESPDDEPFNARELAFIEARALGKTIKDSAKAASPPYPYSTARLLDDRPDVRAALRQRAREAIDCGVRTLSRASTAAANALVEVAESGGPGDGPRVSSAKAILEIGSRALELEDLAAEVAEIKAQLGALNRPFRRIP